MAKVLFILKYRENTFDCDDYSSYGKGLSSGLYNSANFVCEMLQNNGVEAKLVQVVDNNQIDKEVTEYKPTHVIIEAYWVVPEKFAVLNSINRHKHVKWIVRNHSETPFLANEGIAFGWTIDYLKHNNVYVSSNTIRTNNEIKHIIQDSLYLSQREIDTRCVYLPNYYPIQLPLPEPRKLSGDLELHIGCFGAIRPLKNHMVQAIAAIKFADSLGRQLHFHINGGRLEGRGEPILKNLKELFKRSKYHTLVEHNWLEHSKFLQLISEMEFGLQVSFSETFNIVAADFMQENIPVVTSDQIPWISSCHVADPNDSDDIVRALFKAKKWRWLHNYWNPSLKKLHKYNKDSKYIWLKYLNN